MKAGPSRAGRWKSAIAVTLVLLGLYFTSLYNYLLFHTIAEIFIIVVACGIYIVAWNSRKFLDNNYLLFLGIAYLFIGVLELIHTLAYSGMGIFKGYGADLATQLWVAARYMESLSLLLAPLFFGRKIRLGILFGAYGTASGLVFLSIFLWDIFPTCFVEGVGLTTFKKVSEYIVCLIFSASIALLYRKREDFDSDVYRLLVVSIVLSIAAELAFTFYISVYGLSNLVGHYFTILSFYLIYVAIIETGLQKPYDLLFRNLKKREATLTSIFKAAPTGIGMARDRVIQEVNERLCEITGYSRDELIGQSARILYPSNKDYEYVGRVKYHQIAETGTGVVETRFRCKGGEIIDVLLSSSPLNPSDLSVGVIFTVLDITELNRVKELLHEGEERYKALYEHAPLPYQWLNEEGYIVDINRAWLQTLGYQKEEVIGRRFTDFLDLPSKEIFEGRFAQLKHHGLVADVEFTMKDKDGRDLQVVFECSMGHKAGDYSQQAYCVFKDVTEQKNAEKALRESETRFRELFDNMRSGVAILESPDNGESFVFKDLNKAGLKYGEKRKEEVIGREVREVFPGVEEIGLFDIFKRVYMTGEPQRQPARLYREGELVLWVESYVFKLTAGELVAIIENVTEKKKAEKAKEKLELQLRQAQKMEAIGTLAGGIAHDFNNILGAIIGLSELSMLEAPKGSSLHSHLEKIFEAGMRAKDLVRQILAFSRQKDHELIPMSITPIINETLKFLRSSVPSTVQINCSMEKDAGLILGDPTQIHQVIMNLCANAEHAMREKGGTLDIRLERVDVDKETASLHHNLGPGPHVRIEVRDTGYGIARENLERIFDPYFTTKGVGEGTGLGLAVVQGIVHNHGGAVTVKSEPGKGAAFEVFLPIFEGEEKEAKQKESGGPLPRGTERILLVDDEDVLARVGKDHLEELGYTVTVRTSSLEALELFKKRPGEFDLVITDMSMPGMTGAELSREIMKIRPDMPIILCTGFSHIISREKALKMGIRAFVMKPLRRKDLAESVRRVLDRANQ